MAAKKKDAAPAEAQKLPDPSYPSIEGFIESATAESISETFESLKEQLAGLKGPKAEQGKKVGKAISARKNCSPTCSKCARSLSLSAKGRAAGGSKDQLQPAQRNSLRTVAITSTQGVRDDSDRVAP